MAARRLYSDRSDKKRPPEFVCKIQDMIFNDISKSTRSIDMNMRVPEFQIKCEETFSISQGK